MTFVVRFSRVLVAVSLLASLSGCVPAGQSEIDEEKEPHFIAGKRAINTMDYHGAIQEFEKALEVNPRNSKAHAQLGWLFEEKESDPASAIYHYQKCLALRPNSDNAEFIRQRIMNCKQDLAKTVWPLPITPGMQKQFDQLVDENKRLKEENERWKAHFAALTAQAATNSRSASASSQPRMTDAPASGVASTGTFQPPRPTTAYVPPQRRTHIVQPGETAASISRRYNVSLSDFLSANPTLEPRRMRAGQTVQVPPPRSSR